MDSLIVVPGLCNELTNSELRDCVVRKTQSAIVDYEKQYSLEHSILGSDMLQFLNSGVNDIISEIDNDKNFRDFLDFKHDFLRYTNEFGQAFRNKYHIKKMEIVESLENELGF